MFRMATGLEFAATVQSEGRERAFQTMSNPLRQVARRCLEPTPELRYQQPSNLLDAMLESRRLQKTTALAAGVLLVGIATSVWYVTRFSRDGAVVPDRPEPLTSYGGRQVGTSFSPDGSFFTFAWDGGGAVLDIYTQQVGGTQYRRLTQGQRAIRILHGRRTGSG